MHPRDPNRRRRGHGDAQPFLANPFVRQRPGKFVEEAARQETWYGGQAPFPGCVRETRNI